MQQNKSNAKGVTCFQWKSLEKKHFPQLLRTIEIRTGKIFTFSIPVDAEWHLFWFSFICCLLWICFAWFWVKTTFQCLPMSSNALFRQWSEEKRFSEFMPNHIKCMHFASFTYISECNEAMLTNRFTYGIRKMYWCFCNLAQFQHESANIFPMVICWSGFLETKYIYRDKRNSNWNKKKRGVWFFRFYQVLNKFICRFFFSVFHIFLFTVYGFNWEFNIMFIVEIWLLNSPIKSLV